MRKHDYFHCDNKKCPQALICQRNTMHITHYAGVFWIYSKFAPDKKTGVCAQFWPLDTIELEEKNNQKR